MYYFLSDLLAGSLLYAFLIAVVFYSYAYVESHFFGAVNSRM